MNLLEDIVSKYPGNSPSWQFQDSINTLELFAKKTGQDPQTLFWQLVGSSETEVTDLIRGCTLIVKWGDHLDIIYDGIV